MRKNLKFDKRLGMSKDIVSMILKGILFLIIVLTMFFLLKVHNDLYEKAVANCVQNTELGEITCRYLAR